LCKINMIMLVKWENFVCKKQFYTSFTRFSCWSVSNRILVLRLGKEFRSSTAQLSFSTQLKTAFYVHTMFVQQLRWARHRLVISAAKLCFTWLAGVNCLLFISGVYRQYLSFWLKSKFFLVNTKVCLFSCINT